MSKASTAGGHSCAAFSISGFYPHDREANEIFIKKTKDMKPKDIVKEYASQIGDLYKLRNKMYSTSQPNFETEDLCLEALFWIIKNHGCSGVEGMDSKVIFATLNTSQNSSYWIEFLENKGFKFFGKNQNNWGSMNHFYARNLL